MTDISMVIQPQVKNVVIQPEVKTVAITAPGPQGPRGLAGSGGGSGGTGYVHDQPAASNSWLISHDLGYRPGGVTVVDSAHTQVEGALSYPADDQVRIDFSAPFAGTAYLS